MNFIAAIKQELADARRAFPEPFNSAHEGYALMLEEMDELKDEVWKSPRRRDPGAMRREAIQVGAMALRFLEDICNEELVGDSVMGYDQENQQPADLGPYMDAIPILIKFVNQCAAGKVQCAHIEARQAMRNFDDAVISGFANRRK